MCVALAQSFSCSHALRNALGGVFLCQRGRNSFSRHIRLFSWKPLNSPLRNFTRAFEHMVQHAGSWGIWAGATALVAGLSAAMMRSCLAAPPVKAEQWSRSERRAAEGTTGRSVSLVEPLLRLQTPPRPCPPPGPHCGPPAAHTMESGRSRAGGNGGEFPVSYNKMDSSILVTEGMGHSWSTPRIHHFVRL